MKCMGHINKEVGQRNQPNEVTFQAREVEEDWEDEER